MLASRRGAYRERDLHLGSAWRRTSNGLYLPPKETSPLNDLAAIDLFCGAGGFSLSFHQAGWHVDAAVEREPYAAMTYLCNLGSIDTQLHFIDGRDEQRWQEALATETRRTGKKFAPGSGWISHQKNQHPVEHLYLGDVRSLAPERVMGDLEIKRGDAGCVFGGPPCQGFSMAGKREIMDSRNSLIFEFMRFVVAVRPKSFIMENVSGLLSMVTPQGVPVIDMLARIAEDGHYMTADAFKRTLAAQSEAVGFLPDASPHAKRQSENATKATNETEQLQLLT